MAEYSIPDVMIHRVIPSMFNAGNFPMQWIGDNPTLDERRQYIHDYVKWRLPHDDMEKQERELRDLAERKVAMKLINENVVEIGAEQFEWLIDEMFWHTWLGYLENTPPFPWPCPTQSDELEELSQSFDKWLDIYKREGDLVKVPEQGDSTSSAEQHNASGNETTATTQDLTIAETSNGSDHLQELSEQQDERIERMNKRIQQQGRKISQKDTKIRQRDQEISQKDRRIWVLEELLRVGRDQLQLEQQQNRDLLRLEQCLFRALQQQLNQQTDDLRNQWQLLLQQRSTLPRHDASRE
ncbi:uncharacterized protein NECHADRAFT_85181 [Fusarium vanettenii 77-13-4]|uniref:Uncharacterized protein n=1 Tax=Fusarium vanettenii (strain ATCC MYA-4622 / CBS 123669 / FGSC 9596 / NRRL 45880 / 77-13-4) TaxID=660122 RepID=C7YV79_FUSV7|nr:uncharacterized protein NECHADRAFT_85181 [Fusarium vanettenii 77-13-4]EEU44938.1 hypothetical protein NECHADRAFT_85181 [Fusarium vanettenii 77-13-4]